MNLNIAVDACVKLVSNGMTYAQVERALRRYEYTPAQREEIMQMVMDEISRMKKGN